MHTEYKSQELIQSLKNELSKAKEAAQYWEVMATTDDLTGLHNRRMLDSIPLHIAQTRSTEFSEEITLLFIDLDDFGKINKLFGDDVGDEALRLVGRSIRQNIRKDDIAIRKGGDEFVLFLLGTTPELASAAVVRRLETMLDGDLSINSRGINIPIRGSVGVFSYDKTQTPLDNLRSADALMREQKQGRKKKRADEAALSETKLVAVTY